MGVVRKGQETLIMIDEVGDRLTTVSHELENLGREMSSAAELYDNAIGDETIAEAIITNQKKERSRWPFGMALRSRGGKSRAWRRKG